MKFKFFLVTVLVMHFGLISCKKEIVAPTPTSIIGLWIGTYTETRNTQEYFSFIIKPDGGTLFCESNHMGVQQLAQGVWTLNGSSLSCSYTYFGVIHPTSVQCSLAQAPLTMASLL